MDNYNQNNYPPRFNGYSSGSSAVDYVASQAMKRVYVKMTLGLLVTAVVALLCAGSPGYASFIFSHSWVMWALLIAEFGVVIGLAAAINKMSSLAATLLFYGFAVLNGLTLFTIFYAYSPSSIALTFFITAGTFAAMSLYGFFTNQDLTKMGSILIMALIGLIIASVVNIFVHSSTFNWIISIAGVIIFVGLTAWDTQTIKRMAQMAGPDQVSRIATIGALNLYLDFINLFLYLLRFFGSSRN